MQKENDHSSFQYDLLVVGGGINGAGIAVDAAGRGLSVLLCEANDLASATSSASSKLIHGGLRYLEQYEFLMVRKALAEREVLMNKAPHLIAPLRFILPHAPHLRPRLMIRAGLFLYDHLSTRSKLPGSQMIKFKHSSPLESLFNTGFTYYDCQVDDARLVISNAMAARDLGAEILTRTSCQSALPCNDGWEVELLNQTGESKTVSCRLLVNATGPWAQTFLEENLQLVSPEKIRLVKGSHLIIKKLPEFNQDAYILQNKDGRIIFVIPYLEDYLIIGTTDENYQGDPGDASISEEEKKYLLESFNIYFKEKINESDICNSFSGVRPLMEDEANNPSKVSRDYKLELQFINGHSPLLTVFGGKLTTYRRLAQAAMKKTSSIFPHQGQNWTSQSPLPGGAFKPEEKQTLKNKLGEQLHWLSKASIDRLFNNYGMNAFSIFENATSLESMGINFGHELTEIEVEYLCKKEWAKTADDILWRRSKLGLVFNKEQIKALDDYIVKL